MDLSRFKSYFKPFRGFLLAIIFTLVALNCQAGANQCSDLFETVRSSPWIANLEKASPDAQKFWRDTGKKFQETLQRDLDHNLVTYKRALDSGHPTIAFLFRLGFQFKNSRFVVPDFFFMMKNLDFVRQSTNLPIELKLLWTLKHKQYGLEQAMALDPFQDFPASQMSYETKTSLLQNDAFGKMIASGVFPIGGLESATGVPREYFERTKSGQYILSDFLHDLSHVQSLIENPDFALAQQRVYKTREFRWSQLEKKIGTESMRNHRRRDEGQPTLFIFSESAWGFQARHKDVLKQTPLAEKLSSTSEKLSGETLQSLSPESLTALKAELVVLEKNWWKIVNTYGGAALDLITYNNFSEAKYQFPMNAVLTALQNVNKTGENWRRRDFNDAALVLRFLRESQNFTPQSWEYFAVAKDVKKSKVYQSMRVIFDGHEGSEMRGFSMIAHFLGIRDTTQL